MQITQIILRYYYSYVFYNCTKNINNIDYSNRECLIDKYTWFREYLYTIHDFTDNNNRFIKRPSGYKPNWRTYVPENYFTFKEQYMSLPWLIRTTQETINNPCYGAN